MIEGNRIYIPGLYIVNKIDAITMEELELYDRLPHYVPISAGLDWNLDGLLEEMWSYLNLIRIYTKPKGQIPVRARHVDLSLQPPRTTYIDKTQLLNPSSPCLRIDPAFTQDYESPVILKHTPAHTTVEAFCNKLHKGIIKDFKYALVWGLSVKFNPQKVCSSLPFNDFRAPPPASHSLSIPTRPPVTLTRQKKKVGKEHILADEDVVQIVKK